MNTFRKFFHQIHIFLFFFSKKRLILDADWGLTPPPFFYAFPTCFLGFFFTSVISPRKLNSEKRIELDNFKYYIKLIIFIIFLYHILKNSKLMTCCWFRAEIGFTTKHDIISKQAWNPGKVPYVIRGNGYFLKSIMW